MKNKIFLTIPIMFICFIWLGCSNNILKDEDINTSWVFVANEGNFGASNGSISMIDDFGRVITIEEIGDVVQSLEVYNNKLIVLINNSHKIKLYDISKDGLALPGIEISTDNSSPREMVISNGKLYFSNWATDDVKVFNLYNYVIEASIPVGDNPEGLITDGIDIWVANSGENTVSKINIATYNVDTINVGEGPQNLVLHNNNIYISRTYYDGVWDVFHGTTKIGPEIIINDYSYGYGACGGSVLIYNDDVYRSFEGGIARIENDLSLNTISKIGDYNQSLVYHVEIINDNIWFTLTDYENTNLIKVMDSTGDEIASYSVGIIPGDLAYWKRTD